MTRPMPALLAAAFLLGAGPAAAVGPLDLLPTAPDAPRPAKGEGPKEPAAIPVPAVVPAAVEAYRTLSTIRSQIESDAGVDALVASVDEAAAAADRTTAALKARPLTGVSDRDIIDFRQEMLRQDANLVRVGGKVEDAVQRAWSSRTELVRMAEVWKLTEREVVAAGAAEAVVERATGVRTEVDRMQRRVQERLNRLQGAQDRVAGLRIRVLGWTEEADRADALHAQQLFEIESQPIWKVLSRREPARALQGQFGRSLQHNLSAIEAFLREEGGAFFRVLAVFLAVVAAVAWMGRSFARHAVTDRAFEAPAEALSHPIAAGVLVALSLTTWLLPRAPAVITELAVLVMLPAFLTLVRNVLSRELRAPLYGFTVLFALARLAVLFPESSLPARLLMFGTALVGLFGALRLLRPGAPWREVVKKPYRRRHLALIIALLAAALAVSVVANAIGNASLARRLVDGSLTTGMAALLLVAVARILRALLTGAVRMPGVRSFPALAENADAVVDRGTVLIEWTATILWFLVVLRTFHVEGIVGEAVGGALGHRLRVGGLDVSLGDVVAFGVTLWIAMQFAKLLRIVLEARLGRDGKLPPGVPVAIAKTVAYAVVALGFMTAVLASGMDMTRFTVLLGTLSVGIGFGLQNVVNNFVSGLILLYERPIRVGDVIDVGTATGTVTQIGIRSSTVMTFQGAEVVLPNSILVSNQLTNWTLTSARRRVEIDVGVAYGSDAARVQELLIAAARSVAGVLSDPEPSALFTGFGDSALTFQLRFWTGQSDRYLVIASEVRTAVVARLDADGIAIPFPQRDLHVVSVEGEAVRALRGEGASRK